MTRQDDNNVELAELGKRLREARESLRLSQQYVADRSGIPRTAVSDIERGVRKVDSIELKALAALYLHPVSHFLGECEPDDATRELTRAVAGLTDQQRAEVVRFAQFLRFTAQTPRQTGT